MDTVCAIVPTYNRWSYLRVSVEALLAQTRTVDTVLVVDNASTDETAERLRSEFPSVEVLRLEKNIGSAGGYCEGVRWAWARGFGRIWFVDDDSRLAEDALEILLAHPGRQVVGPIRLWESDGTFAGLPAMRWDMRNPFLTFDGARTPLSVRYPTYDSLPECVDVFDMAWEGMLVPREAVKAAGLPSPGYWTQAEDTDYSFRLRAAGFKLQMLRAARIYRLIHPGPRNAPWKTRFFVRNRIWFNRLYGETAAVRVVRSALWGAHYLLPSIVKLRWIREREYFQAFYSGVREGLFSPPPVHEDVR